MGLISKFRAVIIIAIMIVIVSFVFFNDIATKSHEGAFENYSSSVIKQKVEIFKNSYGIPHIIAGNEHDVFFTLGYMHAQDRLWQMDYFRRTGRGRLSEIFGKRTVIYDKFMRAINFISIAEMIYASLDNESKQILKSYSDGVNFYINENSGSLPFEFGALSYKPAPWHPVDCVIIERLLAFELSISFWGDIAFGDIGVKLSENKAMQLIPGYPDDVPYILDTIDIRHEKKVRPLLQSILSYNRKTDKKDRSRISRLAGSYFDFMKKMKKDLGFEGSAVGSNSWAIQKPDADTLTTYALLANDPHLRLGLPPRWYQVHITCPEMNITGLTIPGIPLFVIGRNDYISWGVTNIMLDDCDYFIEKLDSAKTSYFTDEKGNKAPLQYVRDTILVKNSDDIEYYKRITRRSTVISDNHIMEKTKDLLHFKPDTNFFREDYCLTFSWTGTYFSNEFSAVYKIMKSRNWQDFLAGVHIWGVPGLNFTYADIHGNIGIAPSGMIPQRGRSNPNLFTPGWVQNTSWDGVSRYNNFDSIYNPVKGYVVSANNKTSRNLKQFVTNYWEPPSRSVRITDLLIEYMNYHTGYSARDAQVMQIDLLSPYAGKFLDVTLPVLETGQKYLNKQELKALDKLIEWDQIISMQQPASAIYNAFLERVIYNTFIDNLGERLYREYCFISNIPTRKILELLDNNDIFWFDDIRTKKYETMDYIIIKSFKDAVAKLSDYFAGKALEEWHWGDLHTVTLKHPLSENNFLEPALTIGPFPMGGNNTTINCTEYKYYEPFDVVIGASTRFITDMQDSIVYTTVPGGISGQPMEVNFGDQVQLWLNGGYLELPASRIPGDDFKLRVVLEPDD